MKTWLNTISAASLALAMPALVSPALAQDAPAPAEQPLAVEGEPIEPMDGSMDDDAMSEDTMDAGAEDGDAIKPAQEASEMVGSWLVGTTIMSDSGESVGEINDILVDIETGEITGVVAGAGGFLGMGAKAIAVDWDRLTIDFDGYEVTTDLTREEAEAAAEYQFRDRQVPPPDPELTPDMATDMSADPGTNMDAPMTPVDPNAEVPAE